MYTEANAGAFKANETVSTVPVGHGERPETARADVFRCGTTSAMANNRMSLKRRTDYGNAIRKYMSRPKSAPEFFGTLPEHIPLLTMKTLIF